MKTVKIGQKTIGEGYPTFIIAEVGINHNGSLEIAKKLIELGAYCGVDAVKFQKRDLNSLYKKEFIDDPNKDSQALQTLISVLKEVELSEEDYHELVKYCKEKGVMFLCTAWDKKSVDFLEELNVPAYKIGSPDMTNFPLIKYIASKNKPILISTGMAQLEEIDCTVEYLKKLGAQFALLHCNSTYPAPFKDLNLRFIQALKDRYDIPVGYSGHERGLVTTAVAVGVGANIVERHFTLDRTMKGPDHAASVDPEGFARLVKYIRTMELALGEPIKKFTRGEGLMREVLGKSLVSTQDIKKGEKITEEMVTAKSPARGLSPQLIDKLIGQTTKRAIKKDGYFILADLE